MEMECAMWLWGRSQDSNICYKWITDGDSKAYSAVWNTYGACDTCNEYEILESTDKKYIAWKESPDYYKQYKMTCIFKVQWNVIVYSSLTVQAMFKRDLEKHCMNFRRLVPRWMMESQ